MKRDKHDFIVIGCDGIFDKMDSKDTAHMTWQAALGSSLGQLNFEPELKEKAQDQLIDSNSPLAHKLCGLTVDAILKTCAVRRTCDNITVVIIGFDNFYSTLAQYEKSKSMQSIDHDIIEEVTMEPKYAPWFLPGRRPTSSQSNNIYIESDEVLDILTDPSTTKKESERTSQTIFGDTGDHSFRRDLVAQNSPEKNYVPEGVLAVEITPKYLLSEIAEEDVATSDRL